jgi:hypothetical protein
LPGQLMSADRWQIDKNRLDRNNLHEATLPERLKTSPRLTWSNIIP